MTSSSEIGTYSDVVFLDVFSDNGNKYTLDFNFSNKTFSLMVNGTLVKRWS